MKATPALLQLASSVSAGVVFFDNEQLVLHMNPEAERITGKALKEAMRMPLMEVCRLVDQPSRKPCEGLVEKTLDAGGRLELTGITVIEGHDGIERLVKGTIFVSESGGQGRLGGGLVLEDATSRWMIDAAALRTSRTDFYRILATGIATNLEDMFTVLLAQLAGVERSLQENHPASSRRLLLEVEKLVRRISETSSGLLTPPSPRTEGEGITLAENSVRNCLRTLLPAFEGISVELAFPDRTGYAAMPPDLFEQVLNGYLMNAVEALNGSGTIRLCCCRLELEREMKPLNAGNYVMLTVRDFGNGIPEKDLTRIFEPLFSTRGKGRGLGLSAIWSIVHVYNGFITVASDPIHGTVFGAFIPSAPGAEVESAADLLPRVMLQDLDRTTEGLLRTELAAIGCTVQGRKEQVDEEPPDLLIMQAGSEPVSRAAVTMVVQPEDATEKKLPAGVLLLEEPDTVVSVMEAVARAFWSRELPVFMGHAKDRSGGGQDR